MRKCFSTILRDELNHEEVCRFGTQLTLPGAPIGPLNWEPKTALETAAYLNIAWGYHNGGRYWNGYVDAHKKHPLQVLFTSFLMGRSRLRRFLEGIPGERTGLSRATAKTANRSSAFYF